MGGDERDVRAGVRDAEGRAATLELTGDELRALAAQADALAAQFLSPEVVNLPVFPETSAAELEARFGGPPPLEGTPLDELLSDCRQIFRASRQNNHPRMFGYVASPASPVGAYADLLASALNANVTSWRSAPAATAVERTVVRWLASLVGFDGGGENIGGLLTSGGSMANLVALYVAHRSAQQSGNGGDERDASRRGLWNEGAPATLYASDQVHLSIPKAADVLGLGREQVRVVKSDEEFRLDVRDLRARIEADRGQGLRPFCVVASAGTVSTGAVDPLAESARVAADHGLWLHIDGAYGALAALDPAKRQLFDGLARADSLSLDPHKWLHAPVDCGCLLLREPERARAAFNRTEEGYIKIYEQQPDEAFAFWDYGVELSRPFRALKVWMMLRHYGARRFAETIAEDIRLAAHLAGRIDESEDFERLAPVTLGICCFRFVPRRLKDALAAASGEGERARIDAEVDELNARVMRAVQRGGRAYLSNAVLRGRFALRVSVTNFRTTRRDLDLTLETVRDAGRECMKDY